MSMCKVRPTHIKCIEENVDVKLLLLSKAMMNIWVKTLYRGAKNVVTLYFFQVCPCLNFNHSNIGTYFFKKNYTIW
jgi:hypothetical protein